jgi:hypothetical protein
MREWGLGSDSSGQPHLGGAAPARLAADPGATSGRRHNRRKCDQPINQAIKTKNAELSKTPTATPSHCAQIETLPMALCPCRAIWVHIALGRLMRR